MGIKIVCPSYKRHDNILTKKVINNIILCVPKNEKDIYKEHNPNQEIIAHPDITGLSQKRQWIYDNFGDVFMIDDDITGFYRLWIEKDDILPAKIKDSSLINEIINNVYQIAKELKCYLFGFSKMISPDKYYDGKPFTFGGLIEGCAMGIIKNNKLIFPSHEICKASSDYYISLLSVYYYRYCYKDTRYCFQQKKTFKSIGGLAEYRDNLTEEKDYKMLKKYFGNCIVRRKKAHFRQTNEWQKSIKMPF